MLAQLIPRPKILADEHHVSFNQDASSISFGHNAGVIIHNLNGEKIEKQRKYNNDETAIVERLFLSNLIVTVSRHRPNVLRCFTLNGQLIKTITCRHDILSVRLSKKRLVICSERHLYIHDVKNVFRELHQIQGMPPNVRGVMDLCPDEASILAYPVYDGKGVVNIYDADSLQSVATINAHENHIAAVKLNWDGSLVATASERGTVIRVHSTRTGEKMFDFTRGRKNAIIYALAFSRDSRFLASSGSTGTVHLYKLDQPINATSPCESLAGEYTNYFYNQAMSIPMMDSVLRPTSTAKCRLPGVSDFENDIALKVVDKNLCVLVATKEGYYYVFQYELDQPECQLIHQRHISPDAEELSEDKPSSQRKSERRYSTASTECQSKVDILEPFEVPDELLEEEPRPRLPLRSHLIVEIEKLETPKMEQTEQIKDEIVLPVEIRPAEVVGAEEPFKVPVTPLNLYPKLSGEVIGGGGFESEASSSEAEGFVPLHITAEDKPHLVGSSDESAEDEEDEVIAEEEKTLTNMKIPTDHSSGASEEEAQDADTSSPEPENYTPVVFAPYSESKEDHCCAKEEKEDEVVSGAESSEVSTESEEETDSDEEEEEETTASAPVATQKTSEIPGATKKDVSESKPESSLEVDTPDVKKEELRPMQIPTPAKRTFVPCEPSHPVAAESKEEVKACQAASSEVIQEGPVARESGLRLKPTCSPVVTSLVKEARFEPPVNTEQVPTIPRETPESPISSEQPKKVPLPSAPDTSKTVLIEEKPKPSDAKPTSESFMPSSSSIKSPESPKDEEKPLRTTSNVAKTSAVFSLNVKVEDKQIPADEKPIDKTPALHEVPKVTFNSEKKSVEDQNCLSKPTSMPPTVEKVALPTVSVPAPSVNLASRTTRLEEKVVTKEARLINPLKESNQKAPETSADASNPPVPPRNRQSSLQLIAEKNITYNLAQPSAQKLAESTVPSLSKTSLVSTIAMESLKTLSAQKPTSSGEASEASNQYKPKLSSLPAFQPLKVPAKDQQEPGFLIHPKTTISDGLVFRGNVKNLAQGENAKQDMSAFFSSLSIPSSKPPPVPSKATTPPRFSNQAPPVSKETHRVLCTDSTKTPCTSAAASQPAPSRAFDPFDIPDFAQKADLPGASDDDFSDTPPAVDDLTIELSNTPLKPQSTVKAPHKNARLLDLSDLSSSDDEGTSNVADRKKHKKKSL